MIAKAKDLKNVEIQKQVEDTTHRRYVVSVVSGQEDLVIENLQERVKKQWLSEDIIDYMNPMINQASMKKGEKVIKQKKLYPGYVFIKSRMNDKIWYIIRNTPGIRLIVGADTHPIPVSDEEFKRIVDQIEKSKERSSMNIPYKEGDLVVLKTGDFKDMKWLIRTIDQEKGTVIVNVEMLGRLTPVVIDADKIALVN